MIKEDSNLNVVEIFKKFLLNYILSKFDNIIALNNSFKDILNGMGFNNVSIIPNCLDLNNYYLKHDENFILYGGRMAKIKKIEDLIQAFYLIRNQTNVNLIIVGNKGPCGELLKTMVIKLGLIKRVKFLPLLPREEFIDYLSRCSVFVLPSKYETFPMVILETMACSKCVIARDIPGPNDIIINEKNGFLFEDVADLANILKIILTDKDLRTKIGKISRKNIEETISVTSVVNSYLEIYETL